MLIFIIYLFIIYIYIYIYVNIYIYTVKPTAIVMPTYGLTVPDALSSSSDYWLLNLLKRFCHYYLTCATTGTMFRSMFPR